MENYYDNSSRWVFDSDGNYLHSKRNTYNPNLYREGIFFSDSKKEEDEYLILKELPSLLEDSEMNKNVEGINHYKWEIKEQCLIIIGELKEVLNELEN